MKALSSYPRVTPASDDARALVLGGNAGTLAVTSSFRPPQQDEKVGTVVTARLIPLARTPRGVVLGDSRQDVGVPLDGVFDWVDRTFSDDDEQAFVASPRDIEMLARIGWESPFPDPLRESSILNSAELPDDVAEALANPARALVSCAACRAWCVRDDFVWKEKQLCAWDYHAQVFGKRGLWREGAYEARHFETLPCCAYVVAPLLEDLGVRELLAIADIEQSLAMTLVNALIEGAPKRAYIAVKTEPGYSVLREE